MEGVWVLAFLVNLFLLGSVFDIHFKSPMVHVERTHKAHLSSSSSSSELPIRRVVFIVADGLRADTFYDYPELRPYLTRLMGREKGVAWGVSDTHVPTESRPGHIALFAGFYEDPSAVFTGWKQNLVEFDSVFNRSSGAIALGSPDVVNMFAQGVAKSKIYSETYSSDWQDFLAGNSSILDTWVFDKFQDLANTRKLPKEDGAIMFLHLLGIDNTGHATKPHSIEYKTALTKVDEITAKVDEIIGNYYEDNNTLFIFTSDHGMTDWGSHGSGSPHETETPLVVWGPLIKKVENIRVQQADIASLVSGSLAIDFPTNSIGRFPTNIWTDVTFVYSNLRANLYQVMELVETKKTKTASERNFPLLDYVNEKEITRELSHAEQLAKKGDFTASLELLNSSFTKAISANFYYERYNQQLMMGLSVSSFILLMLLVATVVLNLEDRTLLSKASVGDVKIIGASFILATFVVKGIIGWSMWKVTYCFVPIYLFLLLALKFKKALRIHEPGKIGLLLFLSIVGVQMLVFSFWERWVLSIGLILNLLWAMGSGSSSSMRTGEKAMHFVAVGVLAVFPAVPTIGNSRSSFFTTMGPVISCIVGVLGLAWGRPEWDSSQDKTLMVIQLTLQGSVVLFSHFPASIVTRSLAWVTLLLSPIAPTMISSRVVMIRLLSIFLALGTPFAYLGISYETLFYPVLFLVLLLFFKLEVGEEVGGQVTWSELFSLNRDNPLTKKGKGTHVGESSLHRAFRRAWFHLFFVLFSFFGTGNIGSLSSFDPSSTRCFVSIFSPWVMMILLLTKILCPFLLVSSFMRALLPKRQGVERNFGLLLLLCQGMSLSMFFKVRNTGSWLDIGMSISHFVIVQATTLFLLLFHYVANYLVTYEWPLPVHYLPTTNPNPRAKAS